MYIYQNVNEMGLIFLKSIPVIMQSISLFSVIKTLKIPLFSFIFAKCSFKLLYIFFKGLCQKLKVVKFAKFSEIVSKEAIINLAHFLRAE